jgi:hypothetical protein
VRERADVGVLAVVVDQHVRVHVVGAAVRVRARHLTVVRKQIDPAAVERAADRRLILGPEGRHRRQHELLRFARRVLQIHRRDERRVQVVVVQLVDLHHPLAQLQIPVKRRQVLVHAVDE